MEDHLLKTLYEVLSIDAPSGSEGELATLLVEKLKTLGFEVKKDGAGNVIGFLAGEGEPLLLTAHMDRVPPGKGHVPQRNGDILKSDGTTNLGTDDAAGIVIILEAVSEILTKKLPHPPLVILFTVKEEIGLQGARTVDLSQYHVTRGIGYDNAFEAGVVISSGATYEGFDIEIQGKPTHPGKDLHAGVNALQVFLGTDWMIGESDNGQSRINIGMVEAGTARNVVPGKVVVQGELRSTLSDTQVAEKLKKLEENLKRVCEKYGATYTFITHRHSSSYTVDLEQPLVKTYKKVLAERGHAFTALPTFVGSDANAFCAEKNIQVFTLSTGVVNEHTTEEYVHVGDLMQLTKDLIRVIELEGE